MSSARLSTRKRVKAAMVSSPGPRTGEAAVFRIHFDADFLQQVLVLAQHFCDTAIVKTWLIAAMVKPVCTESSSRHRRRERKRPFLTRAVRLRASAGSNSTGAGRGDGSLGGR